MAKKKAGRPVKNRVKNALQKGNGAAVAEADNTIKHPAVAAEAGERIPASKADYLAAQLHETRAQLVNMKKLLLQKDQILLQKDQALLQKEQAILNLEAKMIDEENRKLRDQHSLEFDKTIHMDDDTGEVYWLKNQAEGQG